MLNEKGIDTPLSKEAVKDIRRLWSFRIMKP